MSTAARGEGTDSARAKAEAESVTEPVGQEPGAATEREGCGSLQRMVRRLRSWWREQTSNDAWLARMREERQWEFENAVWRRMREMQVDAEARHRIEKQLRPGEWIVMNKDAKWPPDDVMNSAKWEKESSMNPVKAPETPNDPKLSDRSPEGRS